MFDQMHFIISCYECFGFFLAHLCSFTNVHEAPIDAANAPSRRPANGRSCCCRSRPPHLCWDWLTGQGEDQKTEGEGSLQYITNIPNTANSLRALSQETPISLGSSPEGLGAGQQDGGLGHTGGWLIEIVVWKDGAIKGFAFAGWKCVTCWVISQYGFRFNKPLEETHEHCK